MPMKPDLSIIIPCYNCTKTLEQAVRSCFDQGLDEAGFTFEIVMVDDGSTDGTGQLLKRLEADSSSRDNGKARVYFHDKNKGGGATRNTAVERAQADVIFCLDSDDMLGVGTLSKMLSYMKEKHRTGSACDGVGIHRSRKFKGSDVNDIAVVHTFGYTDAIIPVEALFQKGEIYCPLYSTFMHTKEAFKAMGGYPTSHGFDTQSFAWRFLMNGLTAYTCPDAIYLHRTNFNRSYYIREYESGKANYNWFLILSEFLYIFKDPIKDLILGFDIHGDKNLFNEVCAEESILVPDYKRYLVKDAKTKEAAALQKLSDQERTGYDCFWLANGSAEKKSYDEALRYFLLAYKKGLRRPERLSNALSPILDGGAAPIDPKKTVEAIVIPEKFVARGSESPILRRVGRRLRKMVKKSAPLHGFLVRIYWLYLGIKSLMGEGPRKRAYYASIKKIKADKRIVVDLKFGGLGDCLVWSTLPRLLKTAYGVDFYLSEQSLNIVKNKDIFRLCFEMNPYFKGTSDTEPFFSFDMFESEKSIYTFLTNKSGTTALETLEQQFGLDGNGKPELYYKPNYIPSYKSTVLVDENFITGKRLGWIYEDGAFASEARRRQEPGDKVEYVDPRKQDLFGYVDLIYSCKYFVCTFSGGASIAACFDKPFSVLWPINGKNGSNYQFRYERSSGTYV